MEDEGPQPPPLVEEGAPDPTPKGQLSGEKQPAPSITSTGGADESSTNAKKRRLK